MVVHKLNLDSFDDIPYSLIALHTSLEDYHLAYLINQKLPILLSKQLEDIHLTSENGDTYFSRFSFGNLEYDTWWDLIQNKNTTHLGTVNDETESVSLFNVTTTAYLLSEFKKVDYFLRIQNCDQNLEEIISTLNNIPRIESIYLINENQIKSKNNLIF